MRRLIALTCFILALYIMSSVAQAQNNVIRVVNPDGSIEEIEIPAGAVPAPAPQEVKPQPKEPADPPMRVKPAQTMPDPEAVKRAVKEAKEEKQQEEKAIKEVDTEALLEAEPDKKPTAEKIEKKAKPAAKAAAKPESSWPPIPRHKPLLQLKVKEASENLPPQTAIPKNLATSVAIQNAPPSSDFKVLKRMYEGAPVYAVVFKTDEGPYIVLIDALSGKVVKKGYQ